MQSKLIEDTIANLSATSTALDKYCNDPKHYNSYTAQLLERLSWDLHKHANELREINYLYGV